MFNRNYLHIHRPMIWKVSLLFLTLCLIPATQNAIGHDAADDNVGSVTLNDTTAGMDSWVYMNTT
jgi:hypothetical protein